VAVWSEPLAPPSPPRETVNDGPAVVLGAVEDIERALHRLKRKVERADLFGELKRRRFARSPGERRREKRGRARSRTIRAATRRAARAARRLMEV
jgi:ribosomal protein S21